MPLSVTALLINNLSILIRLSRTIVDWVIGIVTLPLGPLASAVVSAGEILANVIYDVLDEQRLQQIAE